MGNVRLSQLACVNWLDEGPLAPHVDAFKQYLTDRGYSRNSFANCVGSIAHFAQWVHRRGVDVQRIDEQLSVSFWTVTFLAAAAPARFSAIDPV
jgi:hypothetical protein